MQKAAAGQTHTTSAAQNDAHSRSGRDPCSQQVRLFIWTCTCAWPLKVFVVTLPSALSPRFANLDEYSPAHTRMHTCSVKPMANYDWRVYVPASGEQRGHTFYVAVRPHTSMFLRAVAQCFEVVVFTASLPVSLCLFLPLSLLCALARCFDRVVRSLSLFLSLSLSLCPAPSLSLFLSPLSLFSLSFSPDITKV